MGSKSRERIWDSRIRGAEMLARSAKEHVVQAQRDADATACLAWSHRLEGYGDAIEPSPTIEQCLNGGFGWLEIQCNRCKSRASIPLDCVRRPRETKISALKFSCRSCREAVKYKPRVQLIKLSKERSIGLSRWYHPSEER